LQNSLTSVQIEAGATCFAGLCEALDVVADHFQSVANNPGPGVFLSYICEDMKYLQPSESAGLDNIPGFIINGCY
jgi:hypothetical protein